MTDEVGDYPGENASVEQLLELAKEFRSAAQELLDRGKKGKPITRAPSRLCANHSLELYLSAYLRHRGMSAKEVRGLQHHLGRRGQLVREKGLILRKATEEHLGQMTDGREYLVMRYGPELTPTVTQINRLFATLDEVAKKVKQQILDDKISSTTPQT